MRLPWRKLRPIAPRSPRAAIPDKPSLMSLSEEILATITELLEATSPGSADKLGRVNTLLYRLQMVARHRKIRFNVFRVDHVTILTKTSFLERQGLLLDVREITIKDKANRARDDDAERSHTVSIEAICNLLPHTRGLKKLTYEGRTIPAGVLRALRHIPRVQLCAGIASPFRTMSPVGPDCWALHKNQQLHTLNIKAFCRHWKLSANLMENLRQAILLTCPNIKCLHIDILGQMCGIYKHDFQDPAEYRAAPFGLEFREDDTLPILEELVLLNYPFKNIEGLTFTDTINEAEAQMWARTWDWSRLKRLQTPYAKLINLMSPHLVSLEEVELCDAGRGYNIEEFCLNVPTGLLSIAIPTLQSATLDGILRHAGSLRALEIHRLESYEEPLWSNDVVDLDSLRITRGHCSAITDLSLDIPRMGEWPTDYLQTIASFPNLRRLDLWFELGVTQPKSLARAFVTFSSAEDAYCLLRSFRPVELPPLRRVTCHSGAPPLIENYDNAYRSWPLFCPSSNSTAFTIEPVENCNEAAKGVLSVTCATLPTKDQREAVKTEALRAQSRKGKAVSIVAGVLNRFRRASIGSQEADDEDEESRRIEYVGPREITDDNSSIW